MAVFANLPLELLTKCAEALDDAPSPDARPASDLLNLACTSRKLCEVVIPVLYQSFTLERFSGQEDVVLVAYIRSLANHNHLLQYIKRIDLHNYTWSAHHGIWQTIDLETNGTVWSPDTLGHFFCSRAQNLRDLDIEYPLEGTFLNFSSPSIERLRVRPTFNPSREPQSRNLRSNSYPIDGMLNLNFLESVLSWPALRILQLEATSTFQDPNRSCNDDTLHDSTQLSRIILRLGILDTQSLRALIKRSSALVEFSFVPPTPEDVVEEWDMGSYSENLPAPSEVIAALRGHTATLERITIGRAGSFWDLNYGQVGSLVNFQALKFLQIDIAMLSGWQHCLHILSDYEFQLASAPQFFPSKLGSLLPSSLEQLVLLTEVGPHANRDHTLATIALRIASEARSGYLQSLTSVRILRSKCAYCLQCDRQSVREDLPANHGSSGSVEELKGAQQVMAQLGILLTF